MSKPPVIFLAFANDHQNYLYKLTEEQNAVRKALEPLEKAGLCEVVYETDTDLNKIWGTFDKYLDRIAIFHYGGHAGDYSLMLQKADGQQQLVDGQGLVSFLARQKSLQLVFINGCSSKRQAEELRDMGVPAVIGTSEPINDAAATILSKTFYEGLAAGRSIKQAWLSAKDLVNSDKNKKENGFQRSLFFEKTADNYTKDFPWDLYIRPGAEKVQEWNLLRAASSPLFGLPLPEEAFLRQAEAPFVGLHYFREDDAPIFYGRGAQIRELHNHLQAVHPIILLYGKSGVGKSSMLDAGLLPRIKDQFQITYVRRIQEKGLLGTLDLALDELLEHKSVETQDKEEISKNQLEEALEYLEYLRKVAGETGQRHIEALKQQLEESQGEEVLQLNSILKKWQLLEKASKQPLLIILDQVEEKFTRPMPIKDKTQEDELMAFLTAITPLFGTNNKSIKGKLILSYRKEYHPEVREAFQSLSLPFSELYLKRLDREGIIEAIQGCTQYDEFEQGKVLAYNTHNNPFRLEIERKANGNSLSKIIADDLMEDSESPIAPVLQIILQKLWISAKAKADAQGNNSKVLLTIADYQTLKAQGTTMGEFFQQQMQQLEQQKAHRQAVHSGLALDLLWAHTTEMGTAGSCQQEELLERYELEQSQLDHLLLALRDLYLLNQLDDSNTILVHDTLARVVMQEHSNSDRLGQRAGRILKNKVSAVGFTLSPDYLANLTKARVPGAEAAELKKEHTGPDKYLAALQEALEPEHLERDRHHISKQTHFNFRSGKNAITLDEADLSIVEEAAGLNDTSTAAMRRRTPAETELIRLSRLQRASRQRQRRYFMIAGLVAVAMIMASSVFAFFKMNETSKSVAQVVDLMVKDAKEQIYELEYQLALKKLHTAYSLGENKDAVSNELMELAFFYNEAGKYELAMGITDTILQLQPLGTVGEDDAARYSRIKENLKSLNMDWYISLKQRYYPAMIEVPGGTFTMGSENGDSDEQPAHQVRLDAFQIAETETTVWQYYLYTQANKLEKKPKPSFGWKGDNPMVNVSWYDALGYGNWLSERYNLAKVYPLDNIPLDSLHQYSHEIKADWKASGYRLPTEAEWEYAARGGPDWEDDCLFSGSDIDSLVAWHGRNSDGQTQAVGNKTDNQLELYDMSGNVYEWCLDWYGEGYYQELHESGVVENPHGSDSAAQSRVLRGGMYFLPGIRVADRAESPSKSRNEYSGFRLAKAGQLYSRDAEN